MALQIDRLVGKRETSGNLDHDLYLIVAFNMPNTDSSSNLQPKWRYPFRIGKFLENDRNEVI